MRAEHPAARRHITVNGVVVTGYGVASGRAPDSPFPRGSLEMQLPLFERLGLPTGGLWPGTLNVSIAPLHFRLLKPAYTFERVRWWEPYPPETFSFADCRVVREGRRPVDAFVYYPHPETKPAHFQDASTVEVLAPLIDGISCGDSVTLVFDAGQIEVYAGP